MAFHTGFVIPNIIIVSSSQVVISSFQNLIIYDVVVDVCVFEKLCPVIDSDWVASRTPAFDDIGESYFLTTPLVSRSRIA